MKYRPEIDGLRAVAVLSVLIYHAKFQFNERILLSGGYLGVDIFFVISGFLISKIILTEVANNSFSYRSFYERRARRILPALFLVLICCIPFAWQLMLPTQMLEYAYSAIAAIFFSSNFVFWLQDSYTAQPSALKPLLHTWSLGIEEQFYIIIPAILVLTRHWHAKRFLALLLILFLTSLGIAHILSEHASNANFFLLGSRAWELLAGSLIAFIIVKTQTKFYQHKYAGVISGSSLGVLILCISLFDEQTRHPSMVTLIPICATALIILFGSNTNYTNRLLSLPAMTMVGLISYSLYLWHFPLFAYARLLGEEPGVSIKLALCLASIGLAFGSYKLVEKPFRDKQKVSIKHLKLSLITIGIAIVSFHTASVFSDGFPKRLGNIERFISDNQPIRFANGYHDLTVTQPIVTLGDSHAGVFSNAVKNLADRNNRPFIQMVQDGCPFLLGAQRYDAGKRISLCNDIVDNPNHGARKFTQGIYFYAARYTLYRTGERYGEEPGPPIVLTNNPSGEPNTAWFDVAIVDSIKSLLNQGSKVVLIYPIPEIGFDVPTRFVARFGKVDRLNLKRTISKHAIAIDRQRFLHRSNAISAAYDAVGSHKNLIRVKPSDMLCDAKQCFTHDNEILFYYDDNHLSPKFTSRIIDPLEATLKQRGWLP